ncbi:kinase-like domain-containing protein [Mycena capillaripes]|nr:kinase-like domain-containing protein [Mycena capillaripes]
MGSLRQSQPKKRFSVQITRRIVKQILLALDYLHRECGFIHTGNKASDNLLVCPPDLTQEHIEEFLLPSPVKRHHPITEPTLAPHPIVTISSQPLPNLGLTSSLENLHIKLIDYGQAIPANSPGAPDRTLQPIIICAPEVILHSSWSPAMDIWTVGCFLFECLTDADLFSQCSKPFSLTLQLQNMAKLFGPFPQTFLDRCPQNIEYFDENGIRLRLHRQTSTAEGVEPRRLEDLLPKTKSSDESAAQFLRRCLTLDPEARPSASELLEDPWLKDV